MSVTAPTGNTWTKQINETGEFVRRATTFRNQVTRSGDSGFKAEPGRYHLYVSYACPWAHRTLLLRKLKGLEDAVSFDVVDTLLGAGGWTLRGEEPGATGDTVNQFEYLREAYSKSASDYSGAITVPVLWDKQTNQIVNNESSEIIRQLNTEFNDFAKNPGLDFYPEALRPAIDEFNEWIYPYINNGVYRAGFARSQRAYDLAVTQLFDSLDRVEQALESSRYLTGPTLTEADIRLWPTLLRFDPVYHTHFKCNIRRIRDYPNIWGYIKDIYGLEGVTDTVNLKHIKDHYYGSHESINPHRIIPKGPAIDFTEPHDRANLG